MSNLMDTALEAGRVAAGILREGLSRERIIHYKGDINIVTDVDKRSEQAVVEVVRRRFPDHRILSEEGGGARSGASPYCWIIDPLDGTTNYAHGFPFFGVSIAVERDGQVLCGVVVDPWRDECFAAERGGGARMNGERVAVSTIADLRRALLATGFPYDIHQAEDNNLDHFTHFCMRAQAVRRPGAAALDLCYVAMGRLEGYWELKIQAWDIAAGSLLVEEAGGQVTRLSGKPFDVYGGEVLASNGLIHDQMVEVLTPRRSAADP